MNVPNIETAVLTYYSCIEIGTKEIKAIFGVGDSTAGKMKKPVFERMALEKKKAWKRDNVITEIAFEVWGLDIADLEKRLKKLKSLSGT